MADFTIDIPIRVRSTTSGATGAGAPAAPGAATGAGESIRETKKVTGSIKKLTRTLVIASGIQGILADIIGDLFSLIRPLVKLLGAFLVVIFLPMMPFLSKISQCLCF